TSEISPIDNSQMIAKKIIADNIQDFTSYYTGLYSLDGEYYIEAKARDAEGNFVPLNRIYMPAASSSDIPLSGNMSLYSFAKGTTGTATDISSIEDYEGLNLHSYSAPVTFKIAITPITYRWESVTRVDDLGNPVQTIEQQQVIPGVKNM